MLRLLADGERVTEWDIRSACPPLCSWRDFKGDAEWPDHEHVVRKCDACGYWRMNLPPERVVF